MMIRVHITYVWLVAIITGFLGIAFKKKTVSDIMLKLINIATMLLSVFYLWQYYGG